MGEDEKNQPQWYKMQHLWHTNTKLNVKCNRGEYKLELKCAPQYGQIGWNGLKNLLLQVWRRHYTLVRGLAQTRKINVRIGIFSEILKGQLTLVYLQLYANSLFNMSSKSNTH